ncbi:hypothetical protein Tco_0799198 [Tanacetum coccineum]
MTKLTQKKVKFEWGDSNKEAAFPTVEAKKLCMHRNLALPKGSEVFIAYCDASRKLGRCDMKAQEKRCFLCITLNETTVKSSSLGLDLPKHILNAQTEARKPENIKMKTLGNVCLKMLNFQKQIREQKVGTESDGTLCPQSRAWLPCYGDLRNVLMHESHKIKNTLFIPDFRQNVPRHDIYIVPNMKADNATYVASV